MIQWKKLGRIWETTHRNDWMVSHSANPVAEHIEGSRFRVYFSCRNVNNVSSIAYFEFDLNEPQQCLAISEAPVLSPGPIGTFDDSGASVGCLAIVNGKRYLYYLGWNLGANVPWRNSIGLAVSPRLSEPFSKISLAPIFDRNAFDPYSLSYPWVLYDNDAHCWHMWYGSNLKWGKEQRDMDHLLKYAKSTDGVHWEATGQITLNFKSVDEYAISKPCVVKENGLYRMWYSYRGASYRIGYAESSDGINWQRQDERAGIDVSSEGWDSEMICYPNVFEHAGKKYLLYNGNAYGKTGIGLAEEASYILE